MHCLCTIAICAIYVPRASTARLERGLCTCLYLLSAIRQSGECSNNIALVLMDVCSLIRSIIAAAAASVILQPSLLQVLIGACTAAMPDHKWPSMINAASTADMSSDWTMHQQ